MKTANFFTTSAGVGLVAALLPLAAGGNAPKNAAPAAKPQSIVATAIEAGSFKTLVTALKAAELVQPLEGAGPFTVFAPADSAFAKLPGGTLESLLEPGNRSRLASILKFHVVPGSLSSREVTKVSGATTLQGQRLRFESSNQGVTINGAKILKADIACSNGMIHVIDTVVMPTTDTIVDRATSAGTFGTLLTAAKAADLAGALAGPGPLTVFAPTDEAFAKLPAGTVESLLEPENKAKLASILKLHIVKGRVYGSDAAAAGKADSLLGQRLEFKSRDGKLSVNGAAIVATDIDASNGVIHVIDTVLLPANS